MPAFELFGLVGMAGLAAAVGGSLLHMRSRARARAHIVNRLRARPLSDADLLAVLRRASATRHVASLMRGRSELTPATKA